MNCPFDNFSFGGERLQDYRIQERASILHNTIKSWLDLHLKQTHSVFLSRNWWGKAKTAYYKKGQVFIITQSNLGFALVKPLSVSVQDPSVETGIQEVNHYLEQEC